MGVNTVMDYYGGQNMMNGYGFVGLILNLLIVGVIVWGVVAFVRHMNTSGNKINIDAAPTSALETLKLRYAKGEIDKVEFMEKRSEIEK
jgi:putative membrane protein